MKSKVGKVRVGRIPAEESKEIGRQVEEEGMSIEDCAKLHGISITRVKNTCSGYRNGATFSNSTMKPKYKDSYPQEAIDFFMREHYRVIMTAKLDKEGQPVYDDDGQIIMEPMINRRGEVVKEVNPMPTMEGLAIHFKCDPQTLYNWGDRFPDFGDALAYCKVIAKEHLNQNGLNGLYNCNYAKFVAINTTDMRETVNVTNNDDPFDLEDELSRGIAQVRARNAKASKNE